MAPHHARERRRGAVAEPALQAEPALEAKKPAGSSQAEPAQAELALQAKKPV